MVGLYVPLGFIAAVWAVWAWEEGAYFGTTFYPGAIALAGLLLVLAFNTRLRARLRGPALVALCALLALAAWTALSTAWSSSPSSGVEDAQRALLYAAAFATGLWICNLLGRRMAYSLWPVALAGVAVAIGTLVVLGTGTDFHRYFHDDVTLKFPLGYRNANATFFFICLWPLLTLAADVVRRWEAKVLMIGAGTLMIEIAVLAQSRGSLPAATAALAVFVVASRRSLRAATYVGLALLPVIPAIPALLDVFQHGSLDPGLGPILHHAAKVMVLSVVLSMLLAFGYLRLVEKRVNIGPAGVRRVSRIAGTVAVVVIALGGVLLIKEQGGPLHFLDQKVSEFRHEGNPNFATEGVRFGANVGSNRADFWRVALDEGAAHPLLGGGAGSFQFTYLKERDSPETPNDPHSVEMLMLSELGLPGLALFAAFAIAAAMAAVRSRSLGPAAIAVSTGALAAGAQWLVHSSYDWFWHYPAVTAPAVYLLGCAAAPRLLDPGAGLSRRARRALAVIAAVGMISCVPIYLSEHLVSRAYSTSAQDSTRAISDLDQAARLDPLDAQPLLVKGVLLSREGDRAGAVSAFRDAVGRQPDNYATHYFLAQQLLRTDPREARVEVARAAELNPHGPEVKHLREQLPAR